ncbi:MAG: hypothetical protein DIU84_03135 [Bacillota bacterium]|nr:hypothetical protein [Bacillota bacterium]REJ37831.1 MAG: hypothetical protein DIU84_03135 [Bacillota bacterium]
MTPPAEAKGGYPVQGGNTSTGSPDPRAPEIRVGRELMLLIDEFEQFVNERPRVPLTGKIMFDEDDLYGFIDQLREVIPKEIQRAMQITAERDQILEQAEAQAETIVAEARQYAERLMSESAITRRAEEESGRILAQVREEARTLRREADAYAAAVLSRLEETLNAALNQVRQGKEHLRAIMPASEAAAAQDEDDR